MDKEFNFTANYAKGDGDQFHDWMRRYHPGELMMPVIRTLGGDRQDSLFEGALPVYMGRKFFVQFLHEEGGIVEVSAKDVRVGEKDHG